MEGVAFFIVAIGIVFAIGYKIYSAILKQMASNAERARDAEKV